MSSTGNKSEGVEHPRTASGNRAILATLNDLLRNELAATQSYEQALTGPEGPETRKRFQKCERSHRARAAWLRAQVVAHGGEPTANPPPWRVFAPAGDALGMAEKVTLVALAEGEEHSLREYREALPRLDTPTRTLVSGEMIPEQLRTFEMIIQLKSAFEDASAQVVALVADHDTSSGRSAVRSPRKGLGGGAPHER